MLREQTSFLQSELKTTDEPVRKSFSSGFATRTLLSSYSVSPEYATSVTLGVILLLFLS